MRWLLLHRSQRCTAREDHKHPKCRQHAATPHDQRKTVARQSRRNSSHHSRTVVASLCFEAEAASGFRRKQQSLGVLGLARLIRPFRTLVRVAKTTAQDGRFVCCAMAAALAAALSFPGAASASCASATEAQRVARAEAVLVGRVVRHIDGGTAKFRVLRVRKGSLRVGDVVRVTTEPFFPIGEFDWRPRRGQRWRIYARRSGRDWRTNDCMGTRRT
jgi:hypothetical protein